MHFGIIKLAGAPPATGLKTKYVCVFLMQELEPPSKYVLTCLKRGKEEDGVRCDVEKTFA